MPYATHETSLVGNSQQYSVDMDLCDLLQTMNLDTSLREPRKLAEEAVGLLVCHPANEHDEYMSDDPSYQHIHSNPIADNSIASSSSEQERTYGCAFLQVVRSQMEDYPTTNGEYLDAIFTHREILYSFPAGHYECARAFTDIAYMLEKRAWRADREADTEAVTAFRHEAWVIASSLAPIQTKPIDSAPCPVGSGAPFIARHVQTLSVMASRPILGSLYSHTAAILHNSLTSHPRETISVTLEKFGESLKLGLANSYARANFLTAGSGICQPNEANLDWNGFFNTVIPTCVVENERFSRQEDVSSEKRTETSRPITDLKRCATQEEQNEADDKARREALRDLIESWMDRLQLISVITTFFASTEASIITISAPSSDGTDPVSITSQVANIGIMGALVVHSNAAFISFFASFFLIRYKLRIAKKEEQQTENSRILPRNAMAASPSSASFDALDRIERSPKHSTSERITDPIPGMIKMTSPLSPDKVIYSTNPHIVQVGPFQGLPPTHLLSRCHTLCVYLTVVGFVLALTGIICFAWDRMPRSVGISSSFFMLLSLLAGVYIWAKPEPEEGTNSQIYYTG